MPKMHRAGKVSIDIFHEKIYHNDMRYIVGILKRFVNNVTQPGKLIRRKNK